MVLDYSERRQVNRNKPKPKRKSSFGLYLLLFLVIIGVGYGLGFGTAWYLYRPAHIAAAAAKPAAAPAVIPQGAPAPAQQPPAPVQVVTPNGTDVPLTFYETLPKGSKSLIGTGINAPKEKTNAGTSASAPARPEKPAGQSAPASQPPAAAAAVHKESTATAGQEPGRKSFTVQVASSKDRSEAAGLVSKLTAKGMAAYLVETKLEGKGTWYRVRVGKHLERKDADALLGRLGKGAVLIPE